MCCGCWSSSPPTCSPDRPSRVAWTSSSRSARAHCPTSANRCGTPCSTGRRRAATARPRPNGRPDMTAPADRDRVLDRYTKHVNSSLASLARLVAAPVEVAAAGSKVQGSDGQTYLDCGGFGVFLLGHCHPAVVAAVREQLGRNPIAGMEQLRAEQRAFRLAEMRLC